MSSSDFESAFVNILATLPLPAEMRLLGVLLTGSHAAGEAGPSSDVDILAIVRERVIWRAFYRCDGADVDLFAYGKKTLANRLRELEQPLVQIVANGVIKADTDGAVSRVRDLARAVMRGRPNALNPGLILRFRHRIVTALDDCRSLEDKDPNLALTLVASEIPALVKFYFGLRREWTVPLKNAIPAIRAMDDGLATVLHAAIQADRPCRERIGAFTEAVACVLSHCGGERRYFDAYL